jgi:hypothetical protein
MKQALTRHGSHSPVERRFVDLVRVSSALCPR